MFAVPVNVKHNEIARRSVCMSHLFHHIAGVSIGGVPVTSGHLCNKAEQD